MYVNRDIKLQILTERVQLVESRLGGMCACACACACVCACVRACVCERKTRAQRVHMWHVTHSCMECVSSCEAHDSWVCMYVRLDSIIYA